MSYREFIKWASQRAADGLWDYNNAVSICKIIDAINKLPRRKRRKAWDRVCEVTNILEVIDYINDKINSSYNDF